jgi:hypothetical protein
VLNIGCRWSLSRDGDRRDVLCLIAVEPHMQLLGHVIGGPFVPQAPFCCQCPYWWVRAAGMGRSGCFVFDDLTWSRTVACSTDAACRHAWDG